MLYLGFSELVTVCKILRKIQFAKAMAPAEWRQGPLLAVSGKKASRSKGLDSLKAVSVPPPGKRQVNDLTRYPDLLDCFQGLDQDGALLIDIARFAQRVTEGPLEEKGTGR